MVKKLNILIILKTHFFLFFATLDITLEYHIYTCTCVRKLNNQKNRIKNTLNAELLLLQFLSSGLSKEKALLKIAL